MALYQYKGRNENSVLCKGRLQASSEDEVASQLLEQNITPISIKLAKRKISIWKIEIIPSRVKAVDLIMFCRQMYSLIKAGVSLLAALGQLQESSRSAPLKATLEQVIVDVASGKTLAQALQVHPKMFSPVFVNMVDAGENSGQLEEAFEQVSAHLQLEETTKKRVKSITRYPMFVIIALIIAFVIINFMVVPSFKMLYAQFDGTLPLMTRVLIVMSNFLIHYWGYLIIGIVAVMYAWRRFVKSPPGRFFWDRFKLKMPLFGPIINRILMGRFSRTFAMMTRSGVPITHALKLVAQIMDNVYLSNSILKMAKEVEIGRSLSAAANASGLFTSMVLQMISVGEESGSIDALLEEVAGFYEREVEYDLARLSDLIEPILLAIMGALVLVLALGVFLPVWDLIGVAQGG
jgi:MSHA biogenesis protein MshG